MLQSDEGRCHPLPMQWRHHLRQFQHHRSIHRRLTDLQVGRSMAAKRRQPSVMHFEATTVHTVLLSVSSVSLGSDDASPHAKLAQQHHSCGNDVPNHKQCFSLLLICEALPKILHMSENRLVIDLFTSSSSVHYNQPRLLRSREYAHQML